MRTAAAIMAAIILAVGTAFQSHAQEIKRVFPEPAKDYNQRSLEIYEYKKAAQSGPDRGQEIFYYKCWFCHNEYAQTQKGAPPLKDLFQRPVLLSGEKVSADSVKQKIRDGGPGMAAYKTILGEADLNDLLSYLKDKCCWDSDAPPRNPRYVAGPGGPALASLQKAGPLTGGPSGAVKTVKGDALEGIMVQLISKQSAMRTTVYSDHEGRYEFPIVAAGTYTLRIARPLEFYPYSKESVQVEGATKFEDIKLERVTDQELLPPWPEIAAQLSGSEWLQSLSGTGEEKKLLKVYCNFCHSYQQIFRNRYDEESWRKIVFQMTHGAGSPLININSDGRLPNDDEARLVHWLATVRAPDAKDPSFVTMPRPQGRQTKLVVTEYELPRLEVATHDVTGDSKGNVYYSTHRSSYIGRLDPRTGAIHEYHIPPVAAGSLPGTHWLHADKNDILWGSENWAHNIYRLDPATEDFKRVHWNVSEKINSPMGGNYALDPNGVIWKTRNKMGFQIDALTGAEIKHYDLKKFRGTYGSAISDDGRYFGGGAWPRDGVVIIDSKTDEIYEPDSSPNSGPARGEFDPQNNYWSGGRGGQLVEFKMADKKIYEFYAPTPYISFYTAKADKNGEVWGGELQGGRYARFNPKTEQWTEYVLPEPYGHDRESWIDNSTDPVSVWYVDHDGWLVHLQPRQ
jgi:streptogramin lyase/mono/diheme cytochrome c family protein